MFSQSESSFYPFNYLDFYPSAECVAKRHLMESFDHYSANITCPSSLMSPSSLQCLEPMSTHDQNRIAIFYDSASSPPQLPHNESTLWPVNVQRYHLPQVYLPDCFLSETFDSSQSQSSYSSKSDTMKADGVSTGNFHAPASPITQPLTWNFVSRQQDFQSLSRSDAVMDQLETNPNEMRFHGLSHPGSCSNHNSHLIDLLTSPMPIGGPSSIEQPRDQFNNSESTYGYARPPKEFKNQEPTKKKYSSVNEAPKIKRFTCPECGQQFARAFNLQTHVATHTGTRPFSCPADGCSKAFSRRHDLGRHVTAVHHQWLAVRNISVSEAVKSLNGQHSARGRRYRSKRAHTTLKK